MPGVLLFVSCTCLLLCQRTVVVGDDAKMRFKGCSGGDEGMIAMANEEIGGDAVDDGADNAMALWDPSRKDHTTMI